MAEIHLSGGEIRVLKTLGLGGTMTPGKVLMQRLRDFEQAELLDIIQGLVLVGYVLSTRDRLHAVEDMGKAIFRVNVSYSKDLKEAMDPRPQQKKRRRRRE